MATRHASAGRAAFRRKTLQPAVEHCPQPVDRQRVGGRHGARDAEAPRGSHGSLRMTITLPTNTLHAP
jgi:hypothetical protein